MKAKGYTIGPPAMPKTGRRQLCGVLAVLCLLVAGCGRGSYLGEEGVVRQRHSYDCGAASLKMVFNYYGIASTYEELLGQLGATKTGTSMLTLKQLSERRGLKCAGWHLAPSDLHRVPLPAIVFLRRNHFAVLHSFTGDGDALLLDPARGRLRVPPGKLQSMWAGETLLFCRPDHIPDAHRCWFGQGIPQ